MAADPLPDLEAFLTSLVPEEVGDDRELPDSEELKQEYMEYMYMEWNAITDYSITDLYGIHVYP